MIVRMQKITLLASEKYASETVGELRKLGVLHIKHLKKPHANYITSLQYKLARLERALAIIGTSSLQEKELDAQTLNYAIKEIITLDEQRQELIQRCKDLEEKCLWFEEWGKILYSSLGELKRAGIFVKFYIGNKYSLRNISKDKLVYIVRRKKNQVYIVHFSLNPEESLNLPQVEMPPENLYSLQKRRYILSDDLKLINRKLSKFSSYQNCLLNYKKELLKKLEFCQVRFGMVQEESLCCLQGFAPKNSVSKIAKAAKREGWAMIAEEPDNPEEVPTLIRNPKWIEIIKPVFKFMGTLPGYKEYDISFWFLIFFSIFFAMLIGDAGYGLIFLVLTFFARKKLPQLPSASFFLMYVLSSVTIIWGAITGTWFGLERIARMPILNSLVIDKIDSFVASNQVFMIYLCFLIGAIHLSIAHGIVAFRFLNSLLALAQIGWIGIIWTVFFIARRLILDRPIPDFTLSLGILSVALIVLFSHPQKNILKAVAISLADLPLKAISSFSDIVSYLRLFAVGYATLAVASTFNNMAINTGFNSILTGLIAAAILFFGHSLNIILGVLAVIVHGLRLNMLEFSGHLNMQWSGREYKPFKE